MPIVLVGMHLCGDLSLRAVDAFKEIPECACLVLAPCCLPKRGGLSTPPDLYAAAPDVPPHTSPSGATDVPGQADLQSQQHWAWVAHLKTQLVAAVAPPVTAKPTSVDVREVRDVLSARNVLITATRGTRPQGGMRRRELLCEECEAEGE
jgi:hypothetical protein